MNDHPTLDQIAREIASRRDPERYARYKDQRGQRGLFDEPERPEPRDPEFEKLHPREPDGTFTEKQPWHQSRAEYHREHRDKPGYEVASANRQYWQHVGRAIERGDQVPDEIASEYRRLFGQEPEETEKPKDAEKPTEQLVGGRADGQPDGNFDPEALAKGIEHESEHTDDPEQAKEIAKDHLAESPKQDYYERLDQIESTPPEDLVVEWRERLKGLPVFTAEQLDEDEIKRVPELKRRRDTAPDQYAAQRATDELTQYRAYLAVQRERTAPAVEGDLRAFAKSLYSAYCDQLDRYAAP